MLNTNDKKLAFSGGKLKNLQNEKRLALEAYIVNCVKINMLKKWDKYLETKGKLNLRKLLLVPIFQINEMEDRVRSMAPELETIFYKELVKEISKIESKI